MSRRLLFNDIPYLSDDYYHLDIIKFNHSIVIINLLEILNGKSFGINLVYLVSLLYYKTLIKQEL